MQIITYLILCITFLTTTPVMAKEDNINVGFFTSYFDVSVNSREAAKGFELWLNEVTRDNPNIPNATIKYFKRYDEIKKGLEQKQFDILFIQTPYYLRLKESFSLTPFAMSASSKNVGMRYLLLVNKESSIKRIEDLNGKELVVTANVGLDVVAREWLRDLLKKKNLQPQETFFSAIKGVGKTSKAVVQLFFKQIDACLVPESYFEIITEMNPQIAKNLVAIEHSPILLCTIMCYTDTIEPEMIKMLEHNLFQMINFGEGKQISMLFRLKELIPYDEKAIEAISRVVEPYKMAKPY